MVYAFDAPRCDQRDPTVALRAVDDIGWQIPVRAEGRLCRLRMSWKLWLFLGALLVPLSACSSAVRRPQLLHPGPAPFQRHNATQVDPYPQNDMGPPIVGGRPIDFMKPPNEVERARQFRSLGSWRTGPLY